jgi:hypothetical protein
MSFDLAVWYPHQRVTDTEADEIYGALCDSQPTALQPHPAVQTFYEELYRIHPEIDDIPEDRLDDHAYCPWSCAHGRSESYIIMACVWSQADHVNELVHRLARQYGLAVYDPQNSRITYPNARDSNGSKPWWRLW